MQTVTHTTTITSDHTDRSLLNDRSENAVVSVVSISQEGRGGRTRIGKLSAPAWLSHVKTSNPESEGTLPTTEKPATK